MGNVLVVLLALVMIAFVGGEFFSSIGFTSQQDAEIAEIAGETISNARFQAKVDQLSYNFAANAGRNPSQQETEQIRAQAWNALILENAYQTQFDKLGLEVTDAELVDMVQGSNISPQIKQFFTDPQTGSFSKEAVTGFLSNLSQAQPQQRASWIAFEQSLVPSRLVEKYNNLLTMTNYATKYEAKDEYISQNSNATIEYVYVPFSSEDDASVVVSDSELESYLKANELEYQRDEARTLEYVTFEMLPSAADSAVVAEEVAGLKQDLQNALNDSSFVSINSDDAFPFMTYNDDNLPDSLKGKSAGYVSEPVIVNGAYEFLKLSRVEEITADSATYKVAKMKKEFFVSDETINQVYRKADFFAASVGNSEEFKKKAVEDGLSPKVGRRIGKNAQRVGALREARSLVTWLYSDNVEVGSVSDVKEIDNSYVVAVMTGQQKKGLANLDEVRNQVERKVKNEKKADIILKKLKEEDASDFEELAASYGEKAKSGTADYQWFSNSISSVGYAPEAIGLSFALEEEETTQAFALQDGVILIKLVAKALPTDTEDYAEFKQQVETNRIGSTTMVADFPLSYFRIFVSRDIDNEVKEFAEIEDMRYKFF